MVAQYVRGTVTALFGVLPCGNYSAMGVSEMIHSKWACVTNPNEFPLFHSLVCTLLQVAMSELIDAHCCLRVSTYVITIAATTVDGERHVRHVPINDLPAAADRVRRVYDLRVPAVVPQHGDGHFRRLDVVRAHLLLGVSHRHRGHIVSVRLIVCLPACLLPSCVPAFLLDYVLA